MFLVLAIGFYFIIREPRQQEDRPAGTESEES
jgi:hypothetical protein